MAEYMKKSLVPRPRGPMAEYMEKMVPWSNIRKKKSVVLDQKVQWPNDDTKKHHNLH